MLGRLLLSRYFLLHRFVRISKLAGFWAGIEKEFTTAPPSPALVSLYATALPFAEGIIRALLLGLFTQPALVAAMQVIMRLVFGSSLLEKWTLVGNSLAYGLYLNYAGAALAAQPPVPRCGKHI